MHFVDDEDLLAIAHRHDREALDDDLADVVDARVRRGVDLEDVDVATVRNLAAGIAFPARLRRRAVATLAVQRLGQDAGRGGLADTARPGEDERLRHEPVVRDGVAKRARHRLLSDDILETLRPPLSRDDLVRHQGNANR